MDEEASEEQVTLKNVSLLSGNLLSTTVDDMARDMKFFAIFYVVMGGLSCLSIIGAIYGIPLIIYSLKLKDSADEFRRFADSKDFYMLQKAMENQRKFFFFQKVIILISGDNYLSPSLLGVADDFAVLPELLMFCFAITTPITTITSTLKPSR